MSKLSEEKSTLLTKLVRQGLPIRNIAHEVGCGITTVMRRRREMGLVRNYELTVRPKSKVIVPFAEPREPSLAALRLAAFDPIIARALGLTRPTPSSNEDEL